MNKNNETYTIQISKSMQALCMDIYNVINKNPEITLSDIITQTQKPTAVVKFALELLINNNIILSNNNKDNSFKTQKISPLILPSIINRIKYDPYGSEYKNFILNSHKEPYNMPSDINSVSYHKIEEPDYLKNKEFIDYEVISLFLGRKIINQFFLDNYLLAQFSALKAAKANGLDKSLGVYVATQDNKILGLVTISNYDNEQNLGHHLPCSNSEIFNINYIITRAGAGNKGLATNLVRYATSDIIKNNNVYAFCAFPISTGSKKHIENAFDSKKFKIIEKAQTPDDLYKFGSLNSHIILVDNNTPQSE